MSKLVDKERLAKLAQALDTRAKAAVAAEKLRAEAAEQAIDAKAVKNAQDIAAINDAETGILKQAQNYADGKDAAINAKVDQTQYDAKMILLDQADADAAADIADLLADVAELQTKMGDGSIAGVDEKIENAVADLESADQRIEGKADQAQQEVDAVELRVKALEDDAPVKQAAIEAAQDAADEAAQAAATEKDRAEGQEAAIRQEMADEAARVNQKIADDIKVEADRAAGKEAELDAAIKQEAQDRAAAVEAVQGEVDAAEGRIADLEALFQGDNSVDAKIQAVQDALDDEIERAKDEEERIAGLVEDEASKAREEEGKLNDAIAAEAEAARAAEGALSDRIAAFEGEGEGSVKKQIADAVKAEENRAKEVEENHEGRIAANEAKLAGLEKDTVQAAIDQAEADAKAHAEQKIADLVNGAPEAMDTLNELATAINENKDVYDGWVALHEQAMAKQKEDLQAEIDSDIAAARTLISAEIDADVKEEADRAKGEEAAIRGEFAAADTALHTTISAEIDADVKAEKERAEGIEAGLQALIDKLNGADNVDGSVAKAVKDAVDAESQRAMAREDAIEDAFEAADNALNGRLEAVETLVGINAGEGQQNTLDVMQGEIDAVEEEVADLKEADQELQANIDKKVDMEEGKSLVADTEIAKIHEHANNAELDKFEDGDKEALDQVVADMIDVKAHIAKDDGSKALAQQALDAANAAQGDADDNAAAIAKLNGGAEEDGSVAKAIADALKDYSTEAEMLTVIGQVVNSLALSMEDNKMVLKLGGVNGVAIHSTSLDMATDSDIEAIIAGLDA